MKLLTHNHFLLFTLLCFISVSFQAVTIEVANGSTEGSYSLKLVSDAALNEVYELQVAVTGTASNQDFTPKYVTPTVTNLVFTFSNDIESDSITDLIFNDAIFEQDETFQLTHVSSNSVAISNIATFWTIKNEDSLTISVSTNQASGIENDDTTRFRNLTLTFSTDVEATLKPSINIVPSILTNGTDYTMSALSDIVDPTGGSYNISFFHVLNDTTPEPDEFGQFTVSIFANFAGGNNLFIISMPLVTFTQNSVSYTIVNDDPINFSIDSVTDTEGDSGTKAYLFTVTQTPAIPDYTTYFNVFTEDNSADSSDYESFNQRLTIGASGTTRTFTVNVKGDTVVENPEQFKVRLSVGEIGNYPTTTVGYSDGVGVINNNDASLISFSVATRTVSEGAGTFAITINLSATADKDIGFTFVKDSGTATAADFTIDSAVKSIPTGASTATFTDIVSINDDSILEGTETLVLKLTLPTYGGSNYASVTVDPSKSTQTISITDNDLFAGFTSVSDATANPKVEGSGGVAKNMDVLFSFPSPPAYAVNIQIQVVLQTGAGTADANDFFDPSVTSVTYQNTASAGASGCTISIPINGDDVYEPNESFNIKVTSFSINGQVQPNFIPVQSQTLYPLTINDDDVVVLDFTGCAATVNEGAASYSCTPTPVSSFVGYTLTISYDLSHMHGSANTSAATYTYTPSTAGAPTISFSWTDDPGLDYNEYLSFTITSVDPKVLFKDGAGPASLSPFSKTITVVDNDPATVKFDEVSVSEAEGSADAIYTIGIYLTGPVRFYETQVTISITPGSATTPSDYTSTATVITFSAGQTTPTTPVQVTIKGDDLLETHETFSIMISNPVLIIGSPVSSVPGLIIDPTQDTLPFTILNDDNPTFTLSSTSTSGAEGSSASTSYTTFEFTVETDILPTPSSTLSIQVGLAGDTGVGIYPTDSNDFSPSIPTSCSFTSSSSKTCTVNIDVLKDQTLEPDETFVISISNPSFTLGTTGVTLSLGSTTSLTRTITNDDSVDISVTTGQDCDDSVDPCSITFTVTHPCSYPITFDASIALSTTQPAAVSGDFTSLPDKQAITIPADTTTATTYLIGINADTYSEPNEHFDIILDNLQVNAAIDLADITLADKTDMILANNGQPTLDFYCLAGCTSSESATATIRFEINITDGTNVASDLTITYNLDSSTATVGASNDYTLSSSGSLYTAVIPTGSHSVLVEFTVSNDDIIELDETVVISHTSNSALYTTRPLFSSATATINNDDKATITRKTETYAVTETDAPDQNVNVIISSDNYSQEKIMVAYTITQGTAIPTRDYALVSANPVECDFSSSLDCSIVITIVGDDILGQDTESFTVTIDNAKWTTGAITDISRVDVGSSLTSTVTISEDDKLELEITVTPNTLTYSESTSTTGDIRITSTIRAEFPISVTIGLASGGTATSGSDFTFFTTTTLTIAAGSQAVNFGGIAIADDGLLEQTESFILTVPSFSALPAVTTNISYVDTSDVTINIDDNENMVISLQADISLNEGTPPANTVTNFDFVVTLTGGTSDKEIEIDFTLAYATLNGIDNDDLNTAFDLVQTKTIPANTSPYTFTVPIKADATLERTESFTVSISNPKWDGSDPLTAGVSLDISPTDFSKTGTVQNDDDIYVFFPVDDPNPIESDLSQEYIFTLDHPADKVITLSLIVEPDTAIFPDDLSASTATINCNFAIGETDSDLCTVEFTNDNIYEPTENFNIRITGMNYDGGSDLSGKLHIPTTGNPKSFSLADDDIWNTLTYTAVAANEGDSGDTDFTFQFTRPVGETATEAISITFQTEDGTATTADNDYTASTSLTASFAAGATTSSTFIVKVKGDTKIEENETFDVKVTAFSFNSIDNPAAPLIGETYTATINNDDTAMVIAWKISTDTVAEPTSPVVYAPVVTLDKLADSDITLYFSVNAQTAALTTADVGEVGQTLSKVIPANTPIGDFTITNLINLYDDDIVESNEAFILTLVAYNYRGSNTSLTGDLTVTITNNDQTLVSFDLVSYSGAEGSVSTPGSLSVGLNMGKAADADITLVFAFSNTAPSGAPYNAEAGDYSVGSSPDISGMNVKIPAGLKAGTIPIAFSGDAVLELNEEFQITISLPAVPAYGSSSLGLGSNTTTVCTIQNDDEIQVGFVPSTQSVTEGNSFTYHIQVTSGSTEDPFSIAITTSGVSSTFTTADINPNLNKDVINFPTNAEQTGTITAQSDIKLEPSEDFKITIDTSELYLNTIKIAANTGIKCVACDDTVTINENPSVQLKLLNTMPPSQGESSGTYSFAVTVDTSIGTNDVTSELPITFDFTITPVTSTFYHSDANHPDDYTIASTTIVIGANSPITPTLTLNIVSDNYLENSESFTVQLAQVTWNGIPLTSSSSTIIFSSTPSSGQITDDDTLVIDFTSCYIPTTNNIDVAESVGTYTCSSATFYSEVDFTVTVNGDFSNTHQDASTAGASLASPASVANPKTFNKGTNSPNSVIAYSVAVVEDGFLEVGEVAVITLNSPTVSLKNGGTQGSSINANIRIINNDDLEIGWTQTTSSNPENVVAPTVSVTLSTASIYDVRAEYFTSPGTAASPADYTAVPTGTSYAVITAGATTTTVPLTIVNDALLEADETFKVTFQNPQINKAGYMAVADGSFTLSNTELVYTITNNDVPTLSIAFVDPSDATVDEDSSGSPVTAHYKLITDILPDTTFDVNLSVVGTTTYPAAAGDVSYSISPQTFSSSSALELPLTVDTVVDAILEGNESFNVTITSALYGVTFSAFNYGTKEVTTLITDNDAVEIKLPTNLACTEGSGTTICNLILELTGTCQYQITFKAEITIQSRKRAADSSDMTFGNYTITIDPLATQAIIPVTINGDTVSETDEYFTINLSNIVSDPAVQSEISFEAATFDPYILNDEAMTLDIYSNSTSEANGEISFLISVTDGDTITGAPLTITYTLSFSAAFNTASASDFTSPTTGTVDMPVGANQVILVLIVNDEDMVEYNEVFTVTITSAIGVNNPATGTITNDDTAVLSLSTTSPTISATTTVDEDVVGGTVTLYILSNNPIQPSVTVTITTADGTAVAGQDYDLISGTTNKNFDVSTSQSFTVTIRDDILIGADTESFTVTISLPLFGGAEDLSRLTIGASDEVTVSITEDDNTTISVTGTTNVGEDAGTVTVSMDSTKAFEQNVIVTLTASTNSAGSLDYVQSGSITSTLFATETSAQLSFTISEDTLIEDTETFTVTIASSNSASSHVTLSSTPVTITIEDNDVVQIRVEPFVAINEGDGNANTDFNVQLSFAGNPATSDEIITVDVTVAGGASNPVVIGDIVTTETSLPYTISNVEFAAGTKTIDFTVTILGDDIVEQFETFTVTIDNAQWDGQTISSVIIDSSQDSQTITVNNDDSTVISFPLLVPLPDPDEDDGVVNTYTLEMTQAADVIISATVSFVNGGTATPGSDYETTSFPKVVQFQIGSTTSDVFSVEMVDNNIQESDENFLLALSAPKYGGSDYLAYVTTSATTGSSTIHDDDTITSVTIDYTAFSEGNTTGSDVPVTFTVTLPNPADKVINLIMITSTPTATHTATPVVDYERITTTSPVNLQYAVGETSKTFTVRVVQDALLEYDESFSVVVHDYLIAGASQTGSPVIGTEKIVVIENDDQLQLSIADSSVTEGAIPRILVFTITLTQPTTEDILVNVRTVSTGTGLEDASSPSDYIAFASTQIKIPKNNINFDVPVSIFDDSIVEENQKFELEIQTATLLWDNAPNGDISFINSTATGTILNDDSATVILTSATSSIAPTQEAAGTPTLKFHVESDFPSEIPFTVSFTTTAVGSATPSSDFSTNSGTVTFTFSSVSEEIEVDILDDSIVEDTETVQVQISNLVFSPTTISSTVIQLSSTPADLVALGYIGDASDTTAIECTPVSGAENDGPLTFTVTLTNPSSATITFTLATADGTGITGAVSSGLYIDFTAQSSTITFDPMDQTDSSFIVTLTPDTYYEKDEVFSLTVTAIQRGGSTDGRVSVTNASPGVFSTGTIENDDTLTIAINDPSIAEGTGAGTTTLNFAVTLNVNTLQTVTFNYASSDATYTATSGTDFTSVSSSTSIAIGSNSVNIPVTITRDNVVENSETFQIEISNILWGTESGHFSTVDSIGVGTINNDDTTSVFLTFPSGTTIDPEGTGSFTDFDFTISSSNPVDRNMIVTLLLTDLSTNSSDYASFTTSYTINALDTSYSPVTIQIVGDNIMEHSETFKLQVSTVSASGIPSANTSASATETTITIVDDDPITITVQSGFEQDEGNSSTSVFRIPILLSNPTSVQIAVTATTGGGTASTTGPGQDYNPATNVISFMPDATNTDELFDVTVIGDTNLELDETFIVTISNIAGTGLLPGEAQFPAAAANDAEHVTIKNDDGNVVSIDALTVDESGVWTYTVSLVTPIDAVTVVTLELELYTEPGYVGATAADFTTVPTSVSIPVNQTSATVTITLNDDNIVEATESFKYKITDAYWGSNNRDDLTFSTAGVSYIQNDDNTTLTIQATATATEGGPSTQNAISITVSYTKPVDFTVPIVLTTTDDTATAVSNDYVALSFNAVLPTSPTTSYIFQTTVNGDNVLERDETYTITLSFGSAFSNSFVAIDGNQDECVVTIDNDDVLTVSAVSTLTVAEGVSNADITLTFSNPSDSNIQVTINTVAGSATAGSDYTAQTGVVQTLASPGTTFHVLIPILNDNLLEIDETFDVDFSNLVYTGGSLSAASDLVFGFGADSTTVTITDSDLLTISIPAGTYQASEGDIINIPVSLSQNTNEAVIVGYQINLSSEPDGSDISPTPLSGTVTIAQGTNQGTLAIQTAEDTIVEIDEVFSVSLTGVPTWNGLTIPRLSIGSPSSTSATILNDDKTTLTISVESSNPQTEGSLGGYTTPVTIKVTSQYLSSRAIDCKFNTGLLTSTDIQVQTNVNVNIPANQDSATLTVYILADSIVEANEDFTVTISQATWNSATDTSRVDIAVASQTVTITNDDTLTVTVDDYTHAEGNSGTQTFNFYITLSAQSDIPVVLTYTTADIDTESTGPHLDYLAVTSAATISVPAFTTTGTYIAITVYGDNTVEFTETFTVDWDLQAGSRTSFQLPTTTEATGTITNDDTATINFSPATIVAHLENQGGTTTAFTYTVTLSKSCEEEVIVGISILDDSTESADYDPPSVFDLTFAAYDVSETYVVTVVNDEIVEINERFFVVLADDITFDGSATSLVTLGSQSTLGGVILNDDSLTISIDDVSGAEGTGSALTPFVFTITMTKEAGEYISLDVSTISTGEAVALSDYIGYDALNVTFSPGETTKTLTVNIVQDIILEYDETFSVLMSNLSYSPLCSACVSFSDNIGLGTIVNDDSVSIAIDDFTLNEGSSVGSSSQFSFVVRVTGFAGHVLSVEIATADNTAISTGAHADFRAVATHAIYFNTSTSVSVTEVVLVYQDVTLEETESFYVDISNAKFNGATYPTPGFLTISDSRAVGTITNDDSVTVSLSGSTSIVEGNPLIDGPTKTNTFTYTLSNPVEGVVTFTVATANDGSPPSGNAAASAPSDYTAITTTTKTISSYSLSGTFDVITNTDIQVELNETFMIDLALLQKDSATTPNLRFAATNSQTSSFRFTILNDDTYLISVNDPSVIETHTGTFTVEFIVSLSNPIQYDVTFHAATQDGTATVANNDYVALSGNYQIDAGDTQISIFVTINGDSNVEGNETFSLVISNVLVGGNSYPQLISSAKLVGVCTITSDDFLTAIPDQFYYVQGRAQYNADAAHGILANDQIPSSGLTVTLAAGPYHGNITLQQDGSFRYTSFDCSGLDSFTYTLSAFGSNSTGTVLITINPCPLYSTPGHTGQQVFMYSPVGFEWDIPAGMGGVPYELVLLDGTNTEVASTVRSIFVGNNFYNTTFNGGIGGIGPGMWYTVQVREVGSPEFTVPVVSPPEIIFTTGRTLQLKCCRP